MKRWSFFFLYDIPFAVKNTVKPKTGAAYDPTHQEAGARTRQRGDGGPRPQRPWKLGDPALCALCGLLYENTHDDTQPAS